MMGFINVTRYLKTEVAVKVAATEIVAVVAAVVMIVVVGNGTSISVNGISTICASGGMFISGIVGCFTSGLGGSSSVFGPLTPSGALRSLGGTTRGL